MRPKFWGARRSASNFLVHAVAMLCRLVHRLISNLNVGGFVDETIADNVTSQKYFDLSFEFLVDSKELTFSSLPAV